MSEGLIEYPDRSVAWVFARCTEIFGLRYPFLPLTPPRIDVDGFEAAPTVARDIDSQWPVVGQDRLAAGAVAAVANLARFLSARRVPQVLAEFSAQDAFHQRFLEGHQGRIDRLGVHRTTDYLVNQLFVSTRQHR